jgi:hypothetical protein
MSRTYGTPHIAVYIYQPLKWQVTFVLPLWGVFGGIFADNHFCFCPPDEQAAWRCGRVKTLPFFSFLAKTPTNSHPTKKYFAGCFFVPYLCTTKQKGENGQA